MNLTLQKKCVISVIPVLKNWLWTDSLWTAIGMQKSDKKHTILSA